MSCWKRLPLLCIVLLFSFESLLYQVDSLDSSDGGGGGDKQQQQQSSSSSKYKRYKKIEDEFLDFKDRQQMLREYWKQTFEVIKASNPVVFPPPTTTTKGGTGGDEQQKSEGERILLERWKQFSDSGTSIIRPLMEEDGMIETYRREFVEEDRDTALTISTMKGLGLLRQLEIL